MYFLIRLSAILAVLTLFSCSPSIPSTPYCRVSDVLQGELSNSNNSQFNDFFAAACLIKTQNDVLLIRHRLSGKLDFPGGGRKDNESAACTAHRETWEEIGLNVEIQQFLGTTSNGLLLFGCHTQAGVASLPNRFEPPSWATLEVDTIEKADPFLLRHNAMRFPDDLIPLRDGYVAYKTKK